MFRCIAGKSGTGKSCTAEYLVDQYRGLLIDASQCNMQDIWIQAIRMCATENSGNEGDSEDSDNDEDYGKVTGRKRRRSASHVKKTVPGPRQFIEAFLSHQRHGLKLLVIDEADKVIIYGKFQSNLRMVSESCAQAGLRILLITNRSGINHGFPELHVSLYMVDEILDIMTLHSNAAIPMDVMEYIARNSQGAHQALAHLRLAECHMTLTISEWKTMQFRSNLSTVTDNEKTVLTYLLMNPRTAAAEMTKMAEFYDDRCVPDSDAADAMQAAIEQLEKRGMVIRSRNAIKLSQLWRKNMDHLSTLMN